MFPSWSSDAGLLLQPGGFREPPLAPGQTSAHEFGTAGDGDLLGPHQVNFDFSTFKNFKITERQQLQFAPRCSTFSTIRNSDCLITIPIRAAQRWCKNLRNVARQPARDPVRTALHVLEFRERETCPERVPAPSPFATGPGLSFFLPAVMRMV